MAASLQTPVLFTLAENLTQMELNVAVDEADVGQVTAGLEAEFTVDAYPNRRFPATITQVRFSPETINGVVTYAALLSLDNADLSLRPGMTATAACASCHPRRRRPRTTTAAWWGCSCPAALHQAGAVGPRT